MMEAEDLSFCPALVELTRSRRVVGRTGKVFAGLGALSTQNNLIVLRRLMRELKPAHTLEIGLSFGGSALVFTASHRDLGHTPTKQHIALDPFQNSVWDDSGLQVIEQAGLADYLDFRPAFSSLELPRMVGQSPRFDLVYVDGSHLIEDVFVDAYFVTRLLADGGVVAFDDSTDPHVRKVLQFFRTNFREGLEEMDLGPYRADGGSPIKYRLARLLGKVQMTAFRRIGRIEREWNARYRQF